MLKKKNVYAHADRRNLLGVFVPEKKKKETISYMNNTSYLSPVEDLVHLCHGVPAQGCDVAAGHNGVLQARVACQALGEERLSGPGRSCFDRKSRFWCCRMTSLRKKETKHTAGRPGGLDGIPITL